MFVHLHNHTVFSELDGLTQIKPMVAKAKADGQPAMAITDHGRCSGLVAFYSECKSQGIKPILGCEFYMAPGDRRERKSDEYGRNYYHLILLVKNDTGYKNLCTMTELASDDGYYYKPRIDKELLEQYHDGLICLSACVAGRVPQLIIHGDMDGAEQEALWFKNLFGEDYYFEIQNHGLADEETVSYGLLTLSQKLGIKLVCTNDVHYLNEEDAEAHEILLCIQTKKKLSDPDRMVYKGNYSVRPEAEMRKLYPSLQEAFDNTVEVADKCVFEFKFADKPSDYRMPTVVIPKEYGTDYFGYLKDEAYKGLDVRYPEGHAEREQAIKNLEFELSIIKNMGFAEYFLDTRKTVMWSRQNGILVGPGRGSAAGSTMCYCLGITDIDPIRYGLLFERFLNPERVSMPKQYWAFIVNPITQGCTIYNK
ncbi:MAG: DNA polymerase III subunit alpha [Lachnospiraceae bacterium]|nr:DNA polymerase III subunit alpha [Lachnospiraceae bacterium]